MPSVLNIGRFDKNFNFNLRRDPHKISYERRAYESVDEKSLLSYVTKNDEKKNPRTNGLKKILKKI